MKLLKIIPLPICGVMLGLAALGNLLQAFIGNALGCQPCGDTARLVCGGIAALLWIVVVLKMILCFKGVREALNDPVVGSVFCTFPMATMLLAVYAKPYIGAAAEALWYAAVALHAVLIVWFTLKIALPFSLGKVFTSWYIVYVGIAVSSVSAPAFAAQDIGAAAFWFGLASLAVLLVIVTVRYAKLPPKEPAQPLFCIYAAPASLCLAGYIQSVTPKSPEMVIGLLALSSFLLLVTLVKLPKYLSLKFYPSYAAFTFPYVITAIAAMQSMAFFKNAEMPQPWLFWVAGAETVLAALLTIYALVRYLAAMRASMKAAN